MTERNGTALAGILSAHAGGAIDLARNPAQPSPPENSDWEVHAQEFPQQAG